MRFAEPLQQNCGKNPIFDVQRACAFTQALGEYLARPRRFERPTPAFGGQYSIQLSYGRVVSRDLKGTGTEGAKHTFFCPHRP